MKIQYIAHSAFLIETAGKKLLIDPFITGNPNTNIEAKQMEVDYILVSHAHGDHLGDAISIARRSGATIISNFEIVTYCQQQNCAAHPLHIGGGFDFDFGRVKLTIAHHGSTIIGNNGAMTTLGPPCGFLITSENKTIYHSGDTGLFYDMKLIGEMNDIALAMLPIGDNFTMGIDDAVKAVELLQADSVIPMHYNTFDVIQADPHEFAGKVSKIGKTVTVLDFGQSMDF